MDTFLKIIAAIVGVLLIITVLQDSFESIILPRRVSRRFRFSALFYRSIWIPWSALARHRRQGNDREVYLSYFGPLSVLLMLIMWAALLVLAFGLLEWGFSEAVNAPDKPISLGTYLYMSGTTFITLGLGDVTPLSGLGRAMAVLEAGMGFGFLALIIGYVPVIYQAFSRRELDISLLDARAGSPPSATELIRRHYRDQRSELLIQYLHSWETWCAQVLESHLSYPVLTYYRSQHERQSWLAAITAVLDTCSILIVGLDGISDPTVRFTFAIARHAAVDLAQIYGTPPKRPKQDRLPTDQFNRMRASLAEVGLRFANEEDAEQRLAEIRRIYEPFIAALADHLLINLPPWVTSERTVDDWQTSAWDHFAEWSPQKINEITHLIVDHHKKAPMRHEHTHAHEGNENHHARSRESGSRTMAENP